MGENLYVLNLKKLISLYYMGAVITSVPSHTTCTHENEAWDIDSKPSEARPSIQGGMLLLLWTWTP